MALKRLILNRKLAMNMTKILIILIEPLMDATAVAISIVLSMIIRSIPIVSRMPVELILVVVAVSVAALTLTVADLKYFLLKKLQGEE
jgi:hypothetical protein